MSGETIPVVPEAAVGLGAFRALKNGDARAYTNVRFRRGYPAVERFLRTLAAIGYLDALRDDHDPRDCYAVLDVLDENEDILCDFGIPHARAFRYVYRKLELRVAT